MTIIMKCILIIVIISSPEVQDKNLPTSPVRLYSNLKNESKQKVNFPFEFYHSLI